MYKQRIRIQDFFGDFDRLRCGSITPTQFARALGLAGFTMTEAQYSELSDAYPSAVADRPVCYKDFCADVNGVFTKYHLEKAPLEHVEPKPASLLDTERFSAKPTRSLGTEDDERVDQILDAIAEGVRKRRVEVKPFFNDACSNQNSPMRVNHVTKQQFKQVVRAHVARELGRRRNERSGGPIRRRRRLRELCLLQRVRGPEGGVVPPVPTESPVMCVRSGCVCVC